MSAGEQRLGIDAIRSIFERYGLGEAFRKHEPMLLWPQVVGERMSRLTRPSRIRQEVLHIEVPSHVIADQLTMLKDAYLRRLNELLGEERLNDVRFRVGQFWEGGKEPEFDPNGVGSRRGPDGSVESPGERPAMDLVERGQLERMLDELEDPQLREVMGRLIGVIAERNWRNLSHLAGEDDDSEGT